MCRWWYVLPDYPPADFNYQAALKFHKLREIPEKKFSKEVDIKDGLKKVYAIENFKGCYRDKEVN